MIHVSRTYSRGNYVLVLLKDCSIVSILVEAKYFSLWASLGIKSANRLIELLCLDWWIVHAANDSLCERWVQMCIFIPSCNFFLDVAKHGTCCLSKYIGCCAKFTRSIIDETWRSWMTLVNWVCPVGWNHREKACTRVLCRFELSWIIVISRCRIHRPFSSTKFWHIHRGPNREIFSQSWLSLITDIKIYRIRPICLDFYQILPDLGISIIWYRL